MPKNLPRTIARRSLARITARTLGGFSLLLFVTAPLSADTQFRVKHMTRTDIPLGKGQCDIRLKVDNEAEVSVRGDMVYVRTISGRDARDDGSECNEPLPLRGISGFNYEVRDRRNDIVLLSEPTQRTGYRAVVRIRDTDGGEGRYHFRLTWQMDGGGYAPGAGARPADRPRRDFGDNRRDYTGSGRRGFTTRIGPAIDACGDAVADRIAAQYRYSDLDILNIRAENGPGANDYVAGEVAAGLGRDSDRFSFTCEVDLNSGRVRNVSVQRR